MKLVSVIVPTYGRSELLPRAIESIRNQTYKNIEIIVVDDNVEKDLSSKTKEIVCRYPGVIYKKNNMNLGGALSRNEGINISTGDYISFLDDDDYYLENKISDQIAFLEKTSSDVVLCNMKTINTDGEILPKKHIARCNDLGDFIIRGVAFTPMILMKRTAAFDVSLFSDTPRFQDHIFLLKLLGNGKKISVLNSDLAVHLEHTGPRISHSDKQFIGYKIRLEYERALFKKLDGKSLASSKLKHATIESKVISDTSNRFYGIFHLIKNLINIRTFFDLKLFLRNLVRNLFFVGSYF